MSFTTCSAALVVGLCLVSNSLIVSANETFKASVLNPSRAFGYTIGDLLEQKVRLHDQDTTFSLDTLPIEQREGRWVQRSKVTLNANGTELNIRYQIINAPIDVRLISLPELLLRTHDNANITVPTWEFTIGPLIPESEEALARVPIMQPDTMPGAPISVTEKLNLRSLIAALAATLVLWLLWWLWRNWREAHSLPFALAHNSVRNADKAAQQPDNNDSWLALHQAFNRCAGRSIAAGSIPELLSRVEWLKPLEDDIQTFFKLSSARFFSSEPSQQTFDLKAFAKRLYMAERRNMDKQGRQARINSVSP